MNSGAQVEAWRDYYEKAWKFRMDYMMGLIEQGETCPYRVIQSYLNHERTFSTSLIDGKIVWTEHTYDGDPKALLPTGFPPLQRAIIRGNLYQVPYYTKDENYRLIIDLLVGGNFDCVVELGAGYGQTLLEIFYNGGPRKIRYIGTELTDSGCQAMRKLFSMVPDVQWEVHQVDLLEPDFSFLAPYRRVLFFTVYAIQQVTEIPMKLLEDMATSAEYVKAVHLEPFGFQLEPNLGPMTAQYAKNITERGWNINLGPLLVKAHDAGTIKCSHLLSETMGGGDNPLSLAVWEAGTGTKLS